MDSFIQYKNLKVSNQDQYRDVALPTNRFPLYLAVLLYVTEKGLVDPWKPSKNWFGKKSQWNPSQIKYLHPKVIFSDSIIWKRHFFWGESTKNVFFFKRLWFYSTKTFIFFERFSYFIFHPSGGWSSFCEHARVHY